MLSVLYINCTWMSFVCNLFTLIVNDLQCIFLFCIIGSANAFDSCAVVILLDINK